MSQQSKLRLIRFEHKQLRIKLNEEKAKDSNLIKNILEQQKMENMSSVHKQLAIERIELKQRQKEQLDEHYRGVLHNFLVKVNPPLKPKYREIEEQFSKCESEFIATKKHRYKLKRQSQQPSLTNVLEHLQKQNQIQDELRNQRQILLSHQRSTPVIQSYKSKYYISNIHEQNLKREIDQARVELKSLLIEK